MENPETFYLPREGGLEIRIKERLQHWRELKGRRTKDEGRRTKDKGPRTKD